MRLIDVSFIDAQLFLCEGEGASEWSFLDQLPRSCGVPQEMLCLVRDFSSAMHSIGVEASALRAAGMIGHYREMLGQLDVLRRQREQCLAAYVVRTDRRSRPSISALGGDRPLRAPSSWDACTVAAGLHRDHCFVVENFVSAADAAPLRAQLSAMKRDGTLQPGEVSAGIHQKSRGDLMAWVSTEAGAQPEPLYRLLSQIDAIVGALSAQSLLCDDLGAGRLLVRHEMQVR